MLQLAIPVGRWLGVPLRLHVSFFLLLALLMGYSAVATTSVVRGVALWLALCAAVAVREIARAIAAAYAGTPLRALFLLPFGGVMGLEPREGALPERSRRLIALTGAFANLGVALLLLGFAYGVDPGVNLFRQPWITIEHVLRSAVWLQVAMGVVNLLPTRSLRLPLGLRARVNPGIDSQRKNHTEPNAEPAKAAAPLPLPGRFGKRPAFGIGTALALALIVSGFFLTLLWPVILGVTLLFMNYIGRLASLGATTDATSLSVRDVMLTEYTPLPASGTLRDALRRTTHTLQDTFPVVRGERLVGWISRSTLAARLQAEGDGFLQGSMVRSLQMASPGEKLGEALRRAAALGAGDFVPVVEDGAMIGMLTPNSLERAVGQLRLTQPPVDRDDAG